MSGSLPAELSLAAACCRWPPSAEGDQRIKTATEQPIDWELFDAVISHHRIRPLAHHALRRVQVDLPEPFAQKLASDAVYAGRRSLVLARESIRLQRAFAAQGLPALIIKGVPLAILAYGDLGMKESVDVDILVTPEAADDGRRLLISLGYKAELSGLGPRAFGSYARHIHEAAFHNAEAGTKVDLHWKLVPHSRLLGGMDSNPPTQEIDLPGGTLRTLADDPLFAYLCVHGALHNWFRLKWLADLGALVAARTQAEVVRLYEAAAGYNVGRCAAAALLLCRDLFGISLDAQLSRSLEQDSMAKALVRNVLAALDHRGGTVGPDPFSMPWMRLTAAQFFLAPGAAHTFDQLRVFWNCPTDRAVFLPRGFGFGYHLIRLPMWLGRVGTRAFERERA